MLISLSGTAMNLARLHLVILTGSRTVATWEMNSHASCILYLHIPASKNYIS